MKNTILLAYCNSALTLLQSHGPDPDAPTLDEEMEKVFAMASSDKFSLSRLSPPGPAVPGPAQRRYLDEDQSREYSTHHTSHRLEGGEGRESCL